MPLTSSRLRSASARTTRSFLIVARVIADVAGHAHALVDAPRRGAWADRTGRAMMVGTVGLGAALEVVALDVAGEALALRDARHVDEVAGREHRHVQLLADGVLVTPSRRNSRRRTESFGKFLNWPASGLLSLPRSSIPIWTAM